LYVSFVIVTVNRGKLQLRSQEARVCVRGAYPLTPPTCMRGAHLPSDARKHTSTHVSPRFIVGPRSLPRLRMCLWVCVHTRAMFVRSSLLSYGCLRLTQRARLSRSMCVGQSPSPVGVHGTRTATALMHDSSGSWPSMPPAACDACNAVDDVGVFWTNHALFSFCSRVCHNSQCLHSSHTTAAVCVRESYWDTGHLAALFLNRKRGVSVC
jgi:hypothetical protein